MTGWPGGWIAGWRAALRIARRDAWRNKGRSALIALMIALPVAAASAVSVVAQSDSADPQDQVALQLGRQTQASVSWGYDSTPVVQNPTTLDYSTGDTAGSEVARKDQLTIAEFERRLTAALPAGDRVVPQNRSYQQLVGLGDRLFRTDLIEIDYALTGSGGPVEQLTGRAPAAAGEVVVSRALGRRQQLAIGDRLVVTPDRRTGPRTVTVVGTVGGLPLAGEEALIGSPGTLLAAVKDVDPSTGLEEFGERTWFVTGPAPVTWPDMQAVNQLGATVLSRAVMADPPPVPADVTDYGSNYDSDTVATGAVVVGLVLLQIALMAGPAIAVGTRRNERSLAVVAATGGEGRHLRAIVLAGSALIGLVASVAAAVAGAGTGALLVAVMRSRFELKVARIDVHPADLSVLVVVGTATAFAAALLPARRVRRLDVVAALTGRRPIAAPKLRVPLIGLVLVVAGLGLAWVAAGAAEQFPAVLGLGLAEVGLVVASPAVVGIAARLSSRSPFALRFAFRDAARQRGRTAPAVAAVLAAIAGGMTAIVFVAASEAADRETYTSTVPYGAVDVSLDLYAPTYSAGDAKVAEAALRSSLPVANVAVTRETGDDTYATVWQDCPGTVAGPDGTVMLGGDQAGGSSCSGFSPMFVGADAAAVLAPEAAGAVRSALAAGKVVVFGDGWVRDGTVGVQASRSGEGEEEAPMQRLPAVVVRTGQPLSSPLMPLALAKTLGVDARPSHVVASTTRPVTVLEEGQAQKALQTAGLNLDLNVERGYEGLQEGIFLLAVLGAAAVVALIGTFTAVGLAAAEARADLGTLAAVGAAPGLRRRLGAAQAAAIVVPGAILGVLSGTAAGWVLVRLNANANADWQAEGAWHLTIPWDQAAALGIGIPLLAIVVGFVSVRSRLVLVRRLGE